MNIIQILRFCDLVFIICKDFENLYPKEINVVYVEIKPSQFQKKEHVKYILERVNEICVICAKTMPFIVQHYNFILQ